MKSVATHRSASVETVVREIATFLVEDCDLPGASVHMRTPGEEAGACAGIADRSLNTSVSPTHRFHMASVTKTYVAVLIWKVVEAGELSLDTPIQDLVAAERLAMILDGRSAEGITVRHLLQHCSGLPDIATLANHREAYRRTRQRPIRAVTFSEALELSRNSTFRELPSGSERNAPRDCYSYSSINTELLADIVERYMGKTIRAAVADEIIRPLGLAATALENGYTPDQPAPPGLAIGYSRINPDPSLADLAEESSAMDWCYAMYRHYLVPSLVASPADMMTFFHALLVDQTLIGPDLVTRMTEDTIPVSESRPHLRCGLGMFGRRDPFIIWHNGLMLGYKAVALYVPSTRTLVTACANGDWPTGQGLASWILAHLQEYGYAEMQ